MLHSQLRVRQSADQRIRFPLRNGSQFTRAHFGTIGEQSSPAGCGGSERLNPRVFPAFAQQAILPIRQFEPGLHFPLTVAILVSAVTALNSPSGTFHFHAQVFFKAFYEALDYRLLIVMNYIQHRGDLMVFQMI